jgi:ubiquinol-cytochrome c reductase cytochrome c1 subunit
MNKLLALLVLAPGLAWASSAGTPLEKAPINAHDKVSLQRGAQIFVNHCLNCHSAASMRYSRLTDLGLTEAQIRDNLMFTVDKVGETMKTAMPAKESKTWFGVAPPDLSVVARSRGPDWLYTYLRTFYRDPKTASGWNNAVFPNVAMPHALWTLQGVRALEAAAVKDPAGHERIEYKWSQISQGALTQVEYDALARDLVNFLVYVGEPVANERRAIGIVVLFALGLLFIFVYLLKREFWKDVK